MRRVNYSYHISESQELLLGLERCHRGQQTHARLRMLYLLKSGKVKKRSELCSLLGYSERNLQRWWTCYKDKGLKGLLMLKKKGNHTGGYMTQEAWAALKEELKCGHLARLQDVRRYLSEQWSIDYQADHSISQLFKRHQIKLKTGRRRHKKADLEKQTDFKKNFPHP